MSVSWSARLATGVPELDAQHRELFVRVDALLAALAARRGKLHVQRTFKFLDAYVEEHLRDEVRLMRETGYPLVKAHLAAHDQFVADLRRLEALLREEGDDARSTVAVRAGVLLCDWLKGHIATSDRDFGNYLTQRRAAEPGPDPSAEVARPGDVVHG
jgi:hemerythrin